MKSQRQALLRLLAVLAPLAGCGGKETPKTPPPDTGGGTEATLVPPETMDEIRRLFEHKNPVVARCFAQAVEAGELDKAAKGYVTISATVQPSGSATAVGILETDLKSKTLERCVIAYVEKWEFAKPPRPYQTSYTYRFTEF
jgi:hypothetical protein